MTCCLLEKAERKWGAPPSRAIRTPPIFPLIFCAFLRDSGTPIFQAPKRRRKICGKWAQKWAQKSAHKKSAQKWAQKSAHQKSAQKTGLNIPFVWKMEARKKKKHKKKICAKLAQNPSPKQRIQTLMLSSDCWLPMVYISTLIDRTLFV